MGVFQVSRRFLIILFSSLLAYILLINLFQFVGLNNMFGNGVNSFNNSYFGFTSVITAFENSPIQSDFIVSQNNFFQSVYNTISDLLDSFDLGSTTEWWQIFTQIADLIGNLFTAPVLILISFVKVVLDDIKLLLDIVAWLFQLLIGNFNTPLLYK